MAASPAAASHLSQPAMRTRAASVYVHFPWCLAKCPYCDFVSYARERSAIDSSGYADAVVREIEQRAGSLGGRTVRSIFFGGGTPSLWDPRELGRVVAAVRGAFAVASESELEVTVECNPTSLDRARADALAAVGVNRLSVGTQSLDADQLRFLGRLHDPAGALTALAAALASDVARVSTDLIFGLPGQPPGDAQAQATRLAELEAGGRRLTHLSCYQLTIEPGTQFGTLARKGRLPLADDGIVAEAFLAIDEALVARGLGHYEISNYAVPGDEARHNLGYWRGDEYIGVGCAAYGMVRHDAGERSRGTRYRNTLDPRAYMDQALGGGVGDALLGEALDAEALLRERIMLGLRLAEGLDLAACGADLAIDPFTPERTREIERLARRGRLERQGAVLRIPRTAWLWTDDTAARLF